MAQMSLKIALDFDMTYTADGDTWDKIIDLFQDAGHEVMVVTFREPNQVDPAMIHLRENKKVPTFFTNRTPKRDYMESLGIDINIWIDDSPETIVMESTWTEEQILQWKKDNGYDEKSLLDRLIEEPQHTLDFQDLEDITGGGSIR